LVQRLPPMAVMVSTVKATFLAGLRTPRAIRLAREAASMTHRPPTLAAATAPILHQVRMVATVTLAWRAAAVVSIGLPFWVVLPDTPKTTPCHVVLSTGQGVVSSA